MDESWQNLNRNDFRSKLETYYDEELNSVNIIEQFGIDSQYYEIDELKLDQKSGDHY